MRNRPHHFSANVLPAYIRSTVSSRTRLAKPRRGWKEKLNVQNSLVCHVCKRRERGRTELIIRAQHAVKFSTISQDDEHLSWGRIKKEKEERVGEDAHD
jgi:hypothetical protein